MKCAESKCKNMVWLQKRLKQGLGKHQESLLLMFSLLSDPSISMYRISLHPQLTWRNLATQQLLSLHLQIQPLSDTNWPFPSPNSQFQVEKIWIALFRLSILPWPHHVAVDVGSLRTNLVTSTNLATAVPGAEEEIIDCELC